MKRRDFLLSVLVLAAVALPGPVHLARAAAARPFHSTRISVVVRGTGPDVILIPGLTASRAVWDGTVAALPGYRYHLVQVAGFAGTPPAGNAKGQVVAPVAAEVARYISTMRLNLPALVGHSMGGTIAMMVAARHPSLVGKAMVVDMLPQPAGMLGTSSAGLRGFAGLFRDLGDSPGGRQLVTSLMGMFGNDASADGRSDPGVVARAAHELAVTDLTAELPNIAAPLTIVYAVPDISRRAGIDRSYAAAYAARPGTRLRRVDRSGHMIMYDQPGRFRELLKAFLGS
ncbi:alpha/beta fold hydrolase [Sphingosinicella rhizophila]|uniref:Alpha/beta hydrolase n=1 Tax=Sphingosinicella rhizophila TaxID=3050082 RepID=A0ABU3Q868_9SPHN|nr:alpha/beta hydrolase [Sphingosinicella sp. GR2756]MDT9599604.1 alpha/beta hydrolase [Sphingosinicella sp. GR2756]